MHKAAWNNIQLIQQNKEKKHSEETQTLHAGCSKAEPKIFTPPQTPFLPLSTNPVWWGSMHAILSYCGNRPTNTQTNTNPQTRPQTGPIAIHCTAASVQCKKEYIKAHRCLVTVLFLGAVYKYTHRRRSREGQGDRSSWIYLLTYFYMNEKRWYT